MAASRNVEIKARLTDPERTAALAAALADGPAQELIQVDTFFRSSRGRLKLREFPDGSGQLIQYERPDQAGPKTCDYIIYRTDSPALLKATLTAALGVIGEVRKTRQLYLTGQTRIHLDEVAELGHFLELEVVLTPEQTTAHGEDVAKRLMDKLEIAAADLVTVAYLDLLSGSSS